VVTTSQLSLQDVFRATILAKITYCLPAWSGLCSASDRAKLDSFLSRCKRLGFCGDTVPTISDIFSNADDSLFKAVLKIAIMFFTHTFQMIGINTTISGNAHIPKRSYLEELI